MERLADRARTAHTDAEKAVLRIVDEGRAFVVEEVLGLLRGRFTEGEILEAVRRLEERREVELDPIVPAEWSFPRCLLSTDHSLWLHLIALASIGALAAVLLVPEVYPLLFVRWALGLALVLFLPGYAMVEAIFPRRGDLDFINRLILSFGLSFSVAALVGLILSYTPLGVRLHPLAVSLALFSLAASLLAAHRKFALGRGLAAKLASGATRA